MKVNMIPEMLVHQQQNGRGSNPRPFRFVKELLVGVQFLPSRIRTLAGGNYGDRLLQGEIQHGF